MLKRSNKHKKKETTTLKTFYRLSEKLYLSNPLEDDREIESRWRERETGTVK